MKCPNCLSDTPSESKFCINCAEPLTSAEKTLDGTLDTHFVPVLTLTPGTIFAGRYQVMEELGRGGMGSVYRAFDKKIDEEIALKIIRPDIASDSLSLERFRNELKLARKIIHKNVGRTYELMEEKQTPYITMELVQGEDLKSMIRMMGQMSPGQTLGIAKQICEGLSEAHKLGVVHRDIKPSNIMIDKEGCAHIMDFGIARLMKAKGKTGAGIMVGTPEYMSPEQVEGKETDHRADIYSLGVILYEMLTGQLPFEADTPIALAMMHRNQKPRDPKEINPSIPFDLDHLVLKCLQKNKEDRYQSTEKLLADLKAIKKGIPTTEKKIAEKKPLTSKEITVSLSLKKLMVPLLILLAIAAIIAGILIFSPGKEMAPHSIAVLGFENQTGEPAYDYLQKAMPNLLITSLEQSQYLKVTSWERMHDLLKQEGLSEDDLPGQEISYDLCRREGIEFIVMGSFTKADNTFATDVKVMDVASRNIIKSAGSQGDGVASILRKQIDDLSQEISRGVGLSERKIATESIHIAEVTTTSMEAYNYFLRAREDFEKFYFNDAHRFMERVVELDQEFALAHAYLYRIHLSIGDTIAANESLEKFQEYGKDVKGKEGEYIKALLTLLVDRDQEKYGLMLKELIDRYPQEKRFHSDMAVYFNGQNKPEEAEAELLISLELDPQYGYAINLLAYLYIAKNDFDKALEYFKRYASVSPGDANPFDSMGELYFRMENYEESIKKYQEALEVKPDFGSDWRLAYIYGLRENYSEAMRWIDHAIQAATTDGLRATAFHWQGYFLYLQGKLQQSLSAFDKGAEYAEKAEQPAIKDLALRMKLWICFDWEVYDIYQQLVEERIEYRNAEELGSKTLNQIILLLYQGQMDIRNSQIDAAKEKLEAMKKLIDTLEEPEKNIRQKGDGTLIREILMAEGAYDEAIEAYNQREIVPFNFSQFTTFLRPNTPYILDFTAQAYWKKGDLDKAIAEYKRLISPDPGPRGQLHIHPLAHYRLGKLYEERGQVDQAKEQYQKFLSFCGEGDPGLNAIEDAKTRLAGLE